MSRLSPKLDKILWSTRCWLGPMGMGDDRDGNHGAWWVRVVAGRVAASQCMEPPSWASDSNRDARGRSAHRGRCRRGADRHSHRASATESTLVLGLAGWSDRRVVFCNDRGAAASAQVGASRDVVQDVASVSGPGAEPVWYRAANRDVEVVDSTAWRICRAKRRADPCGAARHGDGVAQPPRSLDHGPFRTGAGLSPSSSARRSVCLTQTSIA